MKRKYIAFLVLTLLTFMFVGKSEMNAQPICNCPIDNSFEERTMHPMSFNYDSGTDNYCTIIVNAVLRRIACPPPGPTYYQYEITGFEVVGICTLTDDEKMQIALKAIMSKNNQYNFSPTYIKIPTCLYEDPFNPGNFDSCDTRCCHIYFESHWDSLVGDHYLRDISFEEQTMGCNPSPNQPCINYCHEDIFPETGYLDISFNMPPPCFSSCSFETTFPQRHADYTYQSGLYINSQYTLGTNGSIPCFSINVFQIRYGTMNIEDALEHLIKISLKDIWLTQGNPTYITLNLWKCWFQKYSPQQVYFPCTDSDCCEITFEILNNGTEARVESRSTPHDICVGNCFEVCEIFNSGPFALAKGPIDHDIYELNENIKIMPNPNTGIFDLEFNSANDEQHSLQVLDLLGQAVYSSDIITTTGVNTLNLDLSSLPVGVYYLQLVNKGLVVTKTKFIKN
jgi:hypothetical protein